MSDDNHTFHLTVLTPEKIIFDGQVSSISSYNEVGPFDVLGWHENFITIVKKEIVVREGKKELLRIPLQQGVLKTSHDKVEVYVGL